VLGSVTARHDEATPSGVEVVRQHIERLGWRASAEADGDRVRLRWHDSQLPSVSVIVSSIFQS